MSLLIDGYNLLNAVGIVGRGVGRSSLERSRRALLNFLAESLDAAEAARTTVVFDASEAPRGLPRVVEHGGLTVRFAAGYADADSLIEELIRADTAPRRLTVVSSDHRLQRAARRRKARAVDSDVWFGEVARRRRDRAQPTETGPAKPHVPLSEAEVAACRGRRGGRTPRRAACGRASARRRGRRQAHRRRSRPDRRSLPARLCRGPARRPIGRRIVRFLPARIRGRYRPDVGPSAFWPRNRCANPQRPNALSEISFRHQAPSQRMHLTAV